MLVRNPEGGIGLAAPDTSDVLLEPVKRSRIYEHIVEQIHALIREGRWAPGDQIPPERELAERFRVSRTSVREALRALEMQGVIESRQGGGIAAGSGADIEDAARCLGDEMQRVAMNVGEGQPFVVFHQRIGRLAVAFGAAGAIHVTPIRRHAAGHGR